MYWISPASCGITFRKMFILLRTSLFRRWLAVAALLCAGSMLHAAVSAQETQEPAPKPAEPPTRQEEPTLAPVVVTAPPPVSASSEVFIPGRDFELLPQGRPADVLRLVPGFVISQHQGGGKAE